MLIRTGKISEALCICFGLGQFFDFRRIPFGLRVQTRLQVLEKVLEELRAESLELQPHN